MNFEVLVLHERLGTVLTLKLPLLVGILGVLVEGILTGEQLAAVLLRARERLAGWFRGAAMRLLEVPREVELPRVLPAAAGEGALERPISAVDPHVPFQLLPIRKTRGTAVKAAHKDTFVGHGRFHRHRSHACRAADMWAIMMMSNMSHINALFFHAIF